MCGACGGRWEGRCGGMMSGVMMGGAMPSAVDPTHLPEPESAGAKLMNQYCAQCHGLPDISLHSAAGWPPVIARMNRRMQWMEQSGSRDMEIDAPTKEELKQMVDYLIKNSAVGGDGGAK